MVDDIYSVASIYKEPTNNTSNINSCEIDLFKKPLSSKEIWVDILTQSEAEYDNLKVFLEDNAPEGPEIYLSPELQFLESYVFPALLPIVEKTLHKAVRMECLTNQRSLFNGIDYIAEQLWNNNVEYPERSGNNLNIFLMPWVQDWLKIHPRPIFPKSWIWSRDYAARIIQAYMRGHFVRKTDECQEMRQFWKIIRRENRERLLREKQAHMYYGEG